MTTVALAHCGAYEEAQVEQALSAALLSLPELGEMDFAGKSVFLKVNLLMRRKPEAAVTTHPQVALAAARFFQARGARVILGDSPGGPMLPARLREVYAACGMTAVAEACGCALNYDCSVVDCACPEGLRVRSVPIVRAMREADYLVSIGKLKAHSMTVMTACAKNIFGCVPGMKKAEFHMLMPDYEDFAHLLLDICELMHPAISILDAVVGMEGDGPSAGEPRFLGSILAGTNPYAVDRVAADLIGFPEADVPMLRLAAERGLRPAAEDIRVLGVAPAALRVADFRPPKTMDAVNFVGGRVPAFLEKMLQRHSTPYPVYDKKRCKSCGICARVCPAKALEMGEKLPEVDLDRCIRCWCCHELCPESAVAVRYPWLARLLWGRRHGKDAGNSA